MQESPTPDAMGMILREIGDRLEVGRMDKLWIFPPLVRGRKEWGLVAVSIADVEPSQRSLFTARYAAELRGIGVTFESEMKSEGKAPADRMPRIMDGVVRRSELQLGDPREIRIGGDRSEFSALLREFGAKEVVDGEPVDTHG